MFYNRDAVLHGLVDDGVDGADKEVESSQEVLSILCEVSLCLSIVKKLFLKLWRLVCKISKTFPQGTLKFYRFIECVRWH